MECEGSAGNFLAGALEDHEVVAGYKRLAGGPGEVCEEEVAGDEVSCGVDDALLFIFDDAFDPEVFVGCIEVALGDDGIADFEIGAGVGELSGHHGGTDVEREELVFFAERSLGVDYGTGNDWIDGFQWQWALIGMNAIDIEVVVGFGSGDGGESGKGGPECGE